VAPTRQIVFYHIGNPGTKVTDPFQDRLVSAKNMWGAPPEIAFWHDQGFQAHLCYRKKPPLDEALFPLI
jgi:hypothetical protein